MIGRRSDDKIAIDPDGYGVVFGGGAATFAGAVTVVGATTGTSTFDYSVNNNSVQAYTIQNNSTGVSAATRFSIVAGSSAGSIQLYGSGHTTPNIMQYASPSSHKFICNGVSRLDLDVSGNATFAGTVIAPAATASLAPLRIPHGTAPTSPTDGDMWTTTAGLYIRINGATVGPLS
jgi:hypothetical protein